MLVLKISRSMFCRMGYCGCLSPTTNPTENLQIVCVCRQSVAETPSTISRNSERATCSISYGNFTSAGSGLQKHESSAPLEIHHAQTRNNKYLIFLLFLEVKKMKSDTPNFMSSGLPQLNVREKNGYLMYLLNKNPSQIITNRSERRR